MPFEGFWAINAGKNTDFVFEKRFVQKLLSKDSRQLKELSFDATFIANVLIFVSNYLEFCFFFFSLETVRLHLAYMFYAF